MIWHNLFFKQANTAALTPSNYTSSTPDGCGSTDQLYAIPVTVRELPIAKFIATGGCITVLFHLSNKVPLAGAPVPAGSGF